MTKVYAQMVYGDLVTFDEFAEEVADSSGVGSASVKAVLDRMNVVLVRHLQHGRRVSVGELGQVYQIYYDVLNEALQEGIRYGDKKKLKLHVEKGEDGAYEIREKDRRKLDQLLVENAGKNSA